MSDIKFVDVYYSLTQSLLGCITPNIEALSMAYNTVKRKLKVVAFTEEEATGLDRENILSAVSEAEGMLNGRLDYEVDFIVASNNIGLADKSDVWLYIRFDSNVK